MIVTFTLLSVLQGYMCQVQRLQSIDICSPAPFHKYSSFDPHDHKNRSSHNLFWAIRLAQMLTLLGSCLQVNSISEVSNVEALVLATVDESGDLWAENGKQADSYSNPYTVEYTVVKGEDGCWRIKENLVIGKTK